MDRFVLYGDLSGGLLPFSPPLWKTTCFMRNEKSMPGERRESKRYWRNSLILLLLPTFHGDWASNTRPDNEGAVVSTVALSQAHAHNDYRHDKPLWEALSKGFASVEADVHLVGGELYLGHWLPQIAPASTLREVYLAPLHQLMARQNGKVYAGYEGVFYLMVDVKTDAVTTYKALRQQLLQFPAFQCNPHFQVFISGNRAVQHILNDTEQVAAVDGRLPDLNKQVDASAMPVVSDNFRKHFKWRGKGPIPTHEKERLRLFADKAHRQGKKLRFWAIPDGPNAWGALLEAGVDFISTDDLQGLEQFLAARTKHTEPLAQTAIATVLGADSEECADTRTQLSAEK